MKAFTGKTFQGEVTSVHLGNNVDLSKPPRDHLFADLAGFDGDKHAGHSREAWDGEWEPQGTLRRNERQWSAVSLEELAEISRQLDLTDVLQPATVGANLCVSGIPEFSLLPRGSKLVFPSGAKLTIEEYNPPCAEMGEQIARRYVTRSGETLTPQSWLRPASGRRGVIGVVDVPGAIHPGDRFEVQVWEEPRIRVF